MNILKKICSSIIVLSLFTPYIALWKTPTIAELRKNIIIEWNVLQLTENGEKLKQTIDRIFTRIEKNEEIIQLISTKMKEIQNDGKARNEASLQVIEYIILKVNYSVVKNNYSVSSIIQEGVVEESTPLTQEEKKLVNARVLKIQSNLFENSTEFLDKLFDEFEKYSNYEETGNIKVNAKIDLWTQLNIDAELKMTDYEYKVATFDSQFKGKLDAYVNSVIRWQEDSNIQLEALVDFISQDGNIYVLLEQLKLEWVENSSIYSSLYEAVKKIADEKKYVKFSDEGTQMALEAFASLTPEKLINEWNLMFRQAMFQPYAKKWDNYLLEPTRHACDSFKKLTNTFDPFNGDSCSESQYQKMIEEMKSEWFTISMKMQWDTNTLMVDTSLWGEGEMKALVQFDTETIERMRLAMVENKEIIQSDKIIIDYKKNAYLNFDIDLEDSSQKMTMESTLNSNNKFSSLEFNGKSINDYQELNSQLSLKNNVISGNFSSLSKSWNYDTNGRIPSNKMTWQISWKTTSMGTLQTLEVNIRWEDLVLKTQPLSASIEYDTWKTNIEYNYTTEGSKIALQMSGEWNSDEKMFRAFEFALSRKDKQWAYNPTDYSRTFSWDYRNSVSSAIKLNNEVLTGNTKFYTEWALFMNIDHSWRIKKDLIDWENNFSLSGTATEELQNISQSSEPLTKVSWNLNILYSDSNDSNIFNFLFNLLNGNKEIINFNLESNADRIYKTIDIQAPSNYSEWEDVIPNNGWAIGWF